MKLYQQRSLFFFTRSLFVSVIGKLKLVITISVTWSAVLCVQTISNYFFVFLLVGKLNNY